MGYVTLNNGVKMPRLGYGVYQTPVRGAEKCVLETIEVDYRSIDITQAYGNEDSVGNALAARSLPREEFFITAKVWIADTGYGKARRSIGEPLKKLKTDYIDLLLIHQPFSDYHGTYRAMEEAYGAGEIQAIGVNNFYPDRLIDLCRSMEVKLAINQVETHMFQQQKKTHKIMKRYGVQIGSWEPFAEGRKDFFNNSVLNGIGNRYGESAAQAVLRFLVRRDVMVIPKTTHGERMEESTNVFNFVLADEEMEVLTGLGQGESAFFSHCDPETVEFLTGLGI